MKRTTVFMIFLICTTTLLIGQIGSVNAYLFDPSVEIGDEIVYEYNSTVDTLTEITHVKVKVTGISNDVENTTVIGFLYGSVNNGESFDAAEQGPEDLATLTDYSLHPSSPIDLGDFFVVPGTKIGIYVSEINATLSSGNTTSIGDDYGIEITGNPIKNTTLLYDIDGIATKYYRTNNEGFRKFDIYSINGRPYGRSIPGYPIFLTIAFVVLGVLGVFFSRFLSKRKKV